MGHSLGALIALLYEGNQPTDQLEDKCDSALKDFALTNLSKLLQCQLSEIPFPKKNNTNKASAIVGFNSFGSLVWPKENSAGIKTPTLLIGGTYDLITPLMNEQFRVFSALNNPSNRFLIIEGASHFSPIRINKSFEENNDLFKVSESFIGSDPIIVQDLSAKFIVEFLKNIKNKFKNKYLNIYLTFNNFKLMAISLKVLAPNKNVYQGEAEEVILPSTTGQLGILPGHISLVTAIDIGVLRLRMNSQWKSIALMGGFAEIESDEVIVLVNNAEIGSEINVKNAEQDLKEAKLAISKFSENEKNPEKIKAFKEVSKAEARIQAAKN